MDNFEIERLHITKMGSEHIIKLAASFKHITGSYLDNNMPNNDAPAIYDYKNMKAISTRANKL